MQPPFVSYAQNAEDVVLWRALGHVPEGRYVDVGANDPDHDSVTKAFHDRGWRGINVEPVPELAALLRAARPGDEVVEAALTDEPVDRVSFHSVVGTGLSSLDPDVVAGHSAQGYEVQELEVAAMTLASVLSGSRLLGGDVHFLKIDVEGAEARVLRSTDFATFRPWVVVVEATAPLTQTPTHEAWEPVLLDAGYAFCFFDGLSRFYLSPDHPELRERLSHGACIFDEYVTRSTQALNDRIAGLEERAKELTRETLRWRSAVVQHWATAVATSGHRPGDGSSEHLERELAAMRATVSWRVTAPLRAVRRAAPGKRS